MKSLIGRHARAAALLAAMLGMAGHAGAATTVLNGTNVRFEFDSALVGLFGTPTVSGNSLVFTPTSFSALSTNGQGIVQTKSTFNVKITGLDGYDITALTLSEGGDYYRIGNDAQVAVGGQIRVLDLLSPLTPQLTDSIQADAPLTASTSLTNFSATNWQADAAVGLPGSWSEQLNLTVENILLASTSAAGSSAFIEKKLAIPSVVISAVPEPHSWAMLLTGLGLLAGWARRRQA